MQLRLEKGEEVDGWVSETVMPPVTRLSRWVECPLSSAATADDDDLDARQKSGLFTHFSRVHSFFASDHARRHLLLNALYFTKIKVRIIMGSQFNNLR